MLLAPFLLLLLRASSTPIIISDALRARVFSGVGGISGGGATSRLIEDYPAAARASIYDALFTQQGAAAFQAVKVEIPADADTTCGAEVAHRHDAADGGSCTRGYEGAFLAEAKLYDGGHLLAPQRDGQRAHHGRDRARWIRGMERQLCSVCDGRGRNARCRVFPRWRRVARGRARRGGGRARV